MFDNCSTDNFISRVNSVLSNKGKQGELGL